MRIEQIRKHYKLNDAAARRCVIEVDRACTRRIMLMFGTDWRDLSRYDRVLNLGRMTLEEATHLLVEAIRLPAYQPTVAKDTRVRALIYSNLLPGLKSKVLAL